MYCLNCGKKVDEGENFCPNCGFDIANSRDPDEKVDNDLLHYEEPDKNSNGMAIAGFICSFFSPGLGLIFGGVGLSRSSKREGKGRGLSIAAIIISLVMFFAQ